MHVVKYLMQPLKASSYLSPMNVSETQMKLVRALMYFSIFDHPLTAEEVVACSAADAISVSEASQALDDLVAKNMISYHEGFYQLVSNKEHIKKRLMGNALAAVYLKRAKWVTTFISCFPFVRGVLISGSLSKGYMDKGSDIDYFIVTSSNRLWICRSLLAIFKKPLKGPLKKYFCFNYFVSEDSLVIKDENIFTATELAFVVPLYGYSYYLNLMHSNKWVKHFYPNKSYHEPVSETGRIWIALKKSMEWILNKTIADKLDKWLLTFMRDRWNKRYASVSEKMKTVNIRTQKGVSKHHEKGHQFVVLDKLQQKANEFYQIHGVRITYE